MIDPSKTTFGGTSPRAPAPDVSPFLRRQASATSGSVEVCGRDAMVASESPGMTIREHHLVPDANHFTCRLDVSTDRGSRWNEGQIEMTVQRLEHGPA
jgi:hypothetical protein